jgi:hypothetical protein
MAESSEEEVFEVEEIQAHKFTKKNKVNLPHILNVFNDSFLFNFFFFFKKKGGFIFYQMVELLYR